MRRLVVATPLLLISLAGALRAQCPDGRPPPCPGDRQPAAPRPNSVAVLLFENRAQDTALTLLAEGLADQITTDLGQVERLDVKSASSVRYALGRGSRDPARIGRAVGARWLVDGQLLAGPGAVRVSVQLIDAPRGSLRWSRTFQRPTDDLFALISSVADSVATAIVGELVPAERARLVARPTANREAYDLYVRGRAAMAEGDGQNLLVARALLEAAVRSDSTFAPALAALASTWVSIADNVVAPRQAYPTARRIADRALHVDPANGEATAALAKIALFYDWDLDGAALLGRRAVALAPRSAEVRLVLGLALTGRGDSAEGTHQLLEAADLDSLSARTLGNVEMGLFFAGRSDELIALGRRVQATDLRALGSEMEFTGLAMAGRCSEARARDPAAGWSPLCRADVITVELVDSVAARVRRTQPYFRAYGLARPYAAAGSPDRALAMLEQAFQDREAWMPFMARDPHFASLRTDPRFVDLQRRIAAAAGRP